MMIPTAYFLYQAAVPDIELQEKENQHVFEFAHVMWRSSVEITHVELASRANWYINSWLIYVFCFRKNILNEMQPPHSLP